MFSALADAGSFVSNEYKLFLHAPPKCASTSILTALVNLIDPEAQVSSNLTSENLSSLDIHPYVRDHYRPTHQCVTDAFASSEFCKILIVRDPLSRFLSAVASKYLIGDGRYANELTLGSTIVHELKKDYSNIQNLRDDIKFVSKRLLTALSLGTGVSHVTPLSDSFSASDLLLFDHVINVSDRQFSDIFLTTINHHLQQFNVSINSLPKCNESPLTIPPNFLDFGVLEHILQVYSEDYALLGMNQPQASDYSSSDFDYDEFAKKNADKLSLSGLFYDVSSRYFLKDDLCKEFMKKVDVLTVQRDDALNWAKNLKVDKEDALNWAKNLKVKKESLLQEVQSLSEYKKNSILHIAQLQEDLELLNSLIRTKDKRIKQFENTLTERLKRSFKLFMRNTFGKLQLRRSKKKS